MIRSAVNLSKVFNYRHPYVDLIIMELFRQEPVIEIPGIQVLSRVSRGTELNKWTGISEKYEKQ